MRKRTPAGPTAKGRDRKRRNRDRAQRSAPKKRVRTLERYRDSRAALAAPITPRAVGPVFRRGPEWFVRAGGQEAGPFDSAALAWAFLAKVPVESSGWLSPEAPEAA